VKPEKEQPIKILLVDDHPVVLSGLRSSLADNHRYEVVGEAMSGLEAIQKAKETRPEIVLMDISLPEMNGLEATKTLRKLLPRTQVIMLTMHKNKEYVMETIRAGAQGYILKDSPPSVLLEAIERVHQQGSFFSPSIEQMLVEEVRKSARARKLKEITILSSREEEVLKMVTRGLTNREIAERLHVSVRTVETHRKSVMRKLNLYTVAELTAYALNEGIISK
jgi:DNA-binding NarL/FixJ family response regulator